MHIYIYSRDIVNCFYRHNFELGGHLGIAVALEVKKEADLDKILERLGLHKNRTTYFKRKQKASSAMLEGLSQRERISSPFKASCENDGRKNNRCIIIFLYFLMTI